MNVRRILNAFIVILVAMVAAGCSSADPICESRIAEAGDYKNGCGLSVPAGADTARLDIQVKLDQGALGWTLTDPQGIVRWQGQAKAGEEVNVSRTFDNPAPGRWDLKFQLAQAAGEYHAPWTVQ